MDSNCRCQKVVRHKLGRVHEQCAGVSAFVLVCVCVCALRVGAWQGKNTKDLYLRQVFASTLVELSLKLVLNAYTKLIKIQLGKKFSSLSNKYCKICRQADSTLDRKSVV